MTLTVKVVSMVRPESNPFDNGVHGSAKLDWVTECWIEAPKTKVTAVPTGAVMSEGVKPIPPFKPTWTIIWFELEDAELAAEEDEVVGAGAGPGAGPYN